MTDLLGLLSGIHEAVNRHGDIHLAITDIEGHRGAVNRRTRTIHLAPGLTLPETLQVLVDGIAALTPTDDEEVTVPIAVGEVPTPRAPAPRHLSVVRAPSSYSGKTGRTTLASDML